MQFLLDRLRDYYTDEQSTKIVSYILPFMPTNDKVENRKQVLELLQKLPSFYTHSILAYKNGRMQPKNRPIHENDFFDIMHLSSAIPYCDVVVTEKKWVDLAKQAKLDELYNTILLSDVKKVPEVLV